MTSYEIVKTLELSNMPNSALAKDLLERLRLATAPVVAKHKWRVPLLKEFYPQNRSLLGLNVNRGASIMIRLRDGQDQFSFLPWHCLLGTLVHELTHNEIGEHSASFYTMMEKLYDEVESSSGSTGSLWGPALPPKKYSFDGNFVKIGGGQLAKSKGLAKDNVKQLAAEAALSRINPIQSRPKPSGEQEVPLTAKERKERFLAAEQKRRSQTQGEQGCSVVKQPSPPSLLNSTTQTVNSVILPIRDMDWTCLVCTETNSITQSSLHGHISASSSSSSVSTVPTSKLFCAWCGCVYGSTLEDADTTEASKGDRSKSTPLMCDRHSSSGRSNSARQLSPGVTFSLQGLCRRTLYEVRGCACCTAEEASASPVLRAPILSLIQEHQAAGGEEGGAAHKKTKRVVVGGVESKIPDGAEVVNLLD